MLTPVQLCLSTAAGVYRMHGLSRAALADVLLLGYPASCVRPGVSAAGCTGRRAGADAGLQATAEGLQDLLDRNALPDVPDYCRVQPGPEAARRLVTYAHKLSYTTFAPLGFVAGQTPLRNFRPPAPQDWQLRASLLHQFAGARVLPSSRPAPMWLAPMWLPWFVAATRGVPAGRAGGPVHVGRLAFPNHVSNPAHVTGTGRGTVPFVTAATCCACKPRNHACMEI